MSDHERTASSAIIDGKSFIAVENSDGGVVDGRTSFSYHQETDAVWADYSGGAVVRGFLVGTRSEERLDFRYVHLNRSGQTASGRCRSRIEVLPDGRLRLIERWAWESQAGEGHSIVEEVSSIEQV